MSDKTIVRRIKCPWCGLLSAEFEVRKFSKPLVKCVCGKYFTVSRSSGDDVAVYKC
jgi:sarcosine oxidase delta subunit